MMNNIIKDSEIAKNAKLFNNIRVVNSIIKEGATIGDDCDIDGVIMHTKTELGRRNLIRNTEIARGSYTGTNTIIKSTNIGRYCCISWNVSIGGGRHNYEHISMYTDYWYKRTFGIEYNNDDIKPNKTIIGNDVWVGANANVIGGVNIGDGCVIGAGAVVTKDIPPYSIAVGVPAKIIKKRFDDEIIELLESIQWWNWSEDNIKKNISFLRNEPNKSVLKRLIEI